jgi:hypothetical protein
MAHDHDQAFEDARLQEPEDSGPPALDGPYPYPAMVMGAKRSRTLGKLATALAKAQGEIGNAHKSSDNPYFNSRYADLASIIDAMRAPFAAAGLACTQFVRTTEPVKMGQSADSDGVMQDDFLAYVDIETVILHESGEFLAEVLRMPVWNPNPQKVGSASTYGRRYGMQAAAGVAAEDDDGNAASGKPAPQKRREPPGPPAQEPSRAAPRASARAAQPAKPRPAEQEQAPHPAETAAPEPRVEPVAQTEEVGKLLIVLARKLGWNRIQMSSAALTVCQKEWNDLTEADGVKLADHMRRELAARG